VTDAGVTRGHGLLEGFLARMRTRKANQLLAGIASQKRILDIGCGSYPLFLLSSAFAERWGVDRVPVSLPDGGAGANLKVIDFDVQSGQELPFPADHFDAVTMLAVFEHIEPSRLPSLLADVRRVLKPGGMHVITTPAGWTDRLLALMARLGLVSHEEIDEHKGSYRHSDIESVLRKAGFRPEEMRFGYFEAGANIWVTATKSP
jgi:SAM-dependent methyltransferase